MVDKALPLLEVGFVSNPIGIRCAQALASKRSLFVKSLSSFTATSVAVFACSESVEISSETCRKWCKFCGGQEDGDVVTCRGRHSTTCACWRCGSGIFVAGAGNGEVGTKVKIGVSAGAALRGWGYKTALQRCSMSSF